MQDSQPSVACLASNPMLDFDRFVPSLGEYMRGWSKVIVCVSVGLLGGGLPEGQT